MGRTVVVEESVALHSAVGKVWLLVGQVTSQKDYVLMAIATPPTPPSTHPGGASQSGASQSGAPPVDEWCVLEHAMEVAAMLPGGVDVVGVAVGCPADRLAALQPWLARLLPRLCPLPPSTPHSSRLLLHSPTGSKSCSSSLSRYKCQTLDLVCPQAGFRPAELRIQPHSLQWLLLHSTLALPSSPPLTLSHSTDHTHLLSTIKAAVRPWQDAVAGASVVVRGRLCEGAEPLARAGEGGGGGGGKKGHSSPHVRETLQATLLIRPASMPPSPTPCTLKGGSLFGMEGTLCYAACLPPRTTATQAATWLREDAVRSMQSRVAALGGDMETSEGAEPGGFSQSCQLPRRVCVALPHYRAPLPLHTYQFLDQTEEEVRCEVAEVLGVEPLEVELQPTAEAFPAPPPSSPPPIPAPELLKEEKAVLPLVAMFIAIGVALVAFGVWLLGLA